MWMSFSAKRFSSQEQPKTLLLSPKEELSRAHLSSDRFCFSELGYDVFETVTLLGHGFLLLQSVILHNINLDRFKGGGEG
jgi:hypothetical protein